MSTGGGEEPRWSATGDTLYYRRNRKIMMVPIQIGDGPDGRPTLTAGTVQVALEATFHNAPGLSFDISDDGQRFLVNKPLADDGAVTEIRLMDGWLNGLDELMR